MCVVMVLASCLLAGAIGAAPASAAMSPFGWGAPAFIDPASTTVPWLRLSRVSCAGLDAVRGHRRRRDDRDLDRSDRRPVAWTAADLRDISAQINGAADVSCPATSLCVIVGGSNVAVSSNPTGGARAWSAFKVDGALNLAAISCPPVSLCAAVDGAGNVVTSTNPLGGTAAWR